MKTESGSTKREKEMVSDDIKIDNEFAALIPPLSKDELSQLEQSLLAEGCREPLLIWKEKNILLDGHNRFSICRRHHVHFEVRFLEFSGRESAKSFIVKNQLARRNLSSEAASYLRGKRYLGEKQGHGGDRSANKATDQNDRLDTAKRLADEYQVGEATIRRDGRFASAVDGIAENCGEKAKQSILGRDTGLSRGIILRVAKMKPKDQQKFMEELLEKGKRPRKPVGRKKATITLPTEPKSLAEKLFQGLGPKTSSAIMEALAELLKGQKTKG